MRGERGKTGELTGSNRGRLGGKGLENTGERRAKKGEGRSEKQDPETDPARQTDTG